MVRTKIISTLGPASSSPAVLRKMFVAGLDVARLNFSHGSTAEHISRIKTIRQLNRKLRRAVKIMQDLEGYRLRVGDLKTGQVSLKKNSCFYLTREKVKGSQEEASFDYHGSLAGVKKGTLIYIDDGKIALMVTAVEKNRLAAKVLTAGILKEHKGINILAADLDFPALTEKDKKDLNVAIEYKLDYLAQSFVRAPEDVELLKSLLSKKHPLCKVFSKIENSRALKNIDDIIDVSDGIIVARGDLGINFPIYKVPVIQKELIKKCRLKNKPVVVATQMLESMIENELPTRAEVSDVANAILDGADFVMLSAETTIGRYPAKTVEMMNNIIKNTESYQDRLGELIS